MHFPCVLRTPSPTRQHMECLQMEQIGLGIQRFHALGVSVAGSNTLLYTELMSSPSYSVTFPPLHLRQSFHSRGQCHPVCRTSRLTPLQTRRDPRCPAHLRRRVYPHSSRAILVRARRPQDLHCRILLNWCTVCYIWRRDTACEFVSEV